MDIKVRDLRQTDIIENENKLMVLVDDDLNLVKNITKEEFLTNIISSTENNALVQETDGNLYVNTSEIADDLATLSDEVDTIETNIGNLTDLTTTDKTNLVAAINEAAQSGGGGSTLFEFKWSDHLLNNISWLRADTFSWQSGDVYVTAYNHLVDDIDGITPETETIGSYTVTFYRATDGHKICLADQEQTVLNIYNSYGIAWYYILDTTNTQFKLPHTKYGFEGLRGNVGDNIDESLPNITGTFSDAGLEPAASLGTSGALYRERNYSGNYYYHAGQQGAGQVYFDFDASRSSSTYQNNAPVQERATQMYLYFYVGDYTQEAIEQTAGLNSELFNNKADIDLSNINPSSSTKNTIIGWGMPDLSAGISKAWGTAHTAELDGWIYLQALVVGNGVRDATLQINGVTVWHIYEEWNSTHITSGFIPIEKGNTYIATGGATSQALIFYPCKGGS